MLYVWCMCSMCDNRSMFCAYVFTQWYRQQMSDNSHYLSIKIVSMRINQWKEAWNRARRCYFLCVCCSVDRIANFMFTIEWFVEKCSTEINCHFGCYEPNSNTELNCNQHRNGKKSSSGTIKFRATDAKPPIKSWIKNSTYLKSNMELFHSKKYRKWPTKILFQQFGVLHTLAVSFVFRLVYRPIPFYFYFQYSWCQFVAAKNIPRVYRPMYACIGRTLTEDNGYGTHDGTNIQCQYTVFNIVAKEQIEHSPIPQRTHTNRVNDCEMPML